tara:strand:- start:6237 stop:7400 length:1164 start_codon:yes stop_codon:yes gene_type:complete
MKVYSKRGNTNYKEKRLVNELRDALKNKSINEFEPAKTFEELESAHAKYCIEDANELENVETDKTQVDNIDMSEEPIKNTDGDIIAETPTPEKTFQSNNSSSDPLNRSEPIIRDYVMDNYNNLSPEGDGSPQSFSEPVDFKDAFEMPNEDDPKEEASSGNQTTPEPANIPNENHVNPSFNEMDSKKAKKKSQRFAKQVTNLICDLSERGFLWATTKDITEAKLTEYEASGEMDLTLLVQLADGQEVAIKQFFAQQRLLSEHEGKIGIEEREELTEALAEVFLEKGIAPTPTQELALIGAKVFGLMLIKGVTIQKQNAAILDQLREQAPEQAPTEPAPEVQYEPEPAEELTPEEITELNEEDETQPTKRRSAPQNITWNDLENVETYS